MGQPVQNLSPFITYDVDYAEKFIPGVLDDAQLLEVYVDQGGVVVYLVDLLSVVDQSRLVDEEGLLQRAEKGRTKHYRVGVVTFDK